jgi:hypothetical protein
VTDTVPPGGSRVDAPTSHPAETDEGLRYRIVTGADDAEFCRRVSALLDEGYELHGSPSITTRHGEVLVAQAVVLAADD